jgi:hypothetical protein
MSDGQNPTRQAMIDVVRETLDFITGDAYYSNSFASPIMDAIWPLVEAYRAEGVAEGREQAARAVLKVRDGMQCDIPDGRLTEYGHGRMDALNYCVGLARGDVR